VPRPDRRAGNMTIVEHGTTPERVLESARALAPAIAERAAEVEAARRVPLLD
jgi:hypothetical protein